MVQTVEMLKAVEVLDVRVCAAKRARVESVSQTVQIQALSSSRSTCMGWGGRCSTLDAASADKPGAGFVKDKRQSP